MEERTRAILEAAVKLGFKVHQFVGGFNRTNELLFMEVARLRKEQIDTAKGAGLVMPSALTRAPSGGLRGSGSGLTSGRTSEIHPATGYRPSPSLEPGQSSGVSSGITGHSSGVSSGISSQL
eukprot:7154893-Pyramimonas_sp.AAC.1